MLCHDVETLLAEYADDALPSPKSAAVGAHLDSCEGCAKELDLLRRSVAALNAASPRSAPDLWASFQARVKQDELATQCLAIRELLPGYRDLEMERPNAERVRTHLSTCDACDQEEVRLAVPLRALEECADPSTTPDLWPKIAARLSATISCADVEKLLPAHLAQEQSQQGVALGLHLENCAACAVSAAVYSSALSCVDRVARAVPDVDLWPAFAARLRDEASREARRPSLARFVGAAAAWLRGPLLQPALGFAAFIAIAMLGQYVTSPERRPQLARVIEPRFHHTPEHAANSPLVQARAADPAPAVGNAEITSTEKSKEPEGQTEKSSGEAQSVGMRDTTNSEPERMPDLPAAKPIPEVRVAFNLPNPGADPGEIPGGVFNVDPLPSSVSADKVSERDGMAAVVQAVEILAGREDVLDRPFDANSNE